MITHYVLGFAFTADGRKVALIKKNRPEWQAGKINGIGGKCEPADGFANLSMSREFREETGLETSKDDWFLFATMTFPNDVLGGEAKVHCFSMFTDDVVKCKTMEDEKVDIYHLDTLQAFPLMENVPMLLSIALNKEVHFSDITFK